jgi:hypothetical protein
MRSEDFFRMLREMAIQEGAVCIAPHQSVFRRYERDYLEQLRRIPSSISAPQGQNPYAMALGHPGRWLMIWIPE